MNKIRIFCKAMLIVFAVQQAPVVFGMEESEKKEKILFGVKMKEASPSMLKLLRDMSDGSFDAKLRRYADSTVKNEDNWVSLFRTKRVSEDELVMPIRFATLRLIKDVYETLIKNAIINKGKKESQILSEPMRTRLDADVPLTNLDFLNEHYANELDLKNEPQKNEQTENVWASYWHLKIDNKVLSNDSRGRLKKCFSNTLSPQEGFVCYVFDYVYNARYRWNYYFGGNLPSVFFALKHLRDPNSKEDKKEMKNLFLQVTKQAIEGCSKK